MVKVDYTSACLDCEWTDSGDNADLAARKHEKATLHSTTTTGVPVDGT